MGIQAEEFQIQNHKHIFSYMNFNYFNYRVKYRLPKTNKTQDEANSKTRILNKSQSFLKPSKWTAAISLLGIYSIDLFIHNTIHMCKEFFAALFIFKHWK